MGIRCGKTILGGFAFSGLGPVRDSGSVGASLPWRRGVDGLTGGGTGGGRGGESGAPASKAHQREGSKQGSKEDCDGTNDARES